MIDGMSIREAVDFIPGFNRTIGLVDVGGLEKVKEEQAKEALIVMVVGLKARWKLTIGYFLVRRTPGSLVKKIIRESLIRTYQVGMTIYTVTADGAKGNIAAFKALGAVIEPSILGDLRPCFQHPKKLDLEVGVVLDYPHMFKLLRQTLADYGQLTWPGHGIIKWEYLVKLQEIQQKHGFRLGNRLSREHIHFYQRKMNVRLAVQAIASDSTARGLFYAQQEGYKGFENKNDVLATAQFIYRNNRLFDVLNTKDPRGTFDRSPLRPSSERVESILKDSYEMLSALTDQHGTPLYRGDRKCGFLGLLGDILVIKLLLRHIENGKLPLEYLLFYKACQDHLEVSMHNTNIYPWTC